MIVARRPPDFWWQGVPHGTQKLAIGALRPFGLLYGAVAASRMRESGVRATLPVLCVGNFVVGGAGKTPTALTLGRRLIARGERPWFLTRGYSSAATHRPPTQVDQKCHDAEDVGDEALLLADVAPTLVSADRVASARHAAEAGASVLVLDDGLQNPALEKDLRLIVVDALAGIGNGLCLPAGPLRAPLATQFEFATALLIVGEGDQGHFLADEARRIGKPVLRGDLVVPPEQAAQFAGRRVFAFAGIGRPAKFFATLAKIGADVVGCAEFPDHHAYGRSELLRLQTAARASDALLVTTEKDFVRLAPLVDRNLPVPVPMPVEMRIADAPFLDWLIENALRRGRS